MSAQTEALSLADLIEPLLCNEMSFHDFADAAIELRRLHEVTAELLTAITKTVEANLHLADGDNCTLIDLVRVLEANGVKV